MTTCDLVTFFQPQVTKNTQRESKLPFSIGGLRLRIAEKSTKTTPLELQPDLNPGLPSLWYCLDYVTWADWMFPSSDLFREARLKYILPSFTHAQNTLPNSLPYTLHTSSFCALRDPIYP